MDDREASSAEFAGRGAGAVDDDLVRTLVDAAPDALVVTDEVGSIVLVNGRTEAMFGYRRDELLGQSVDVLVPEQLRDVHRAHRTRFRVDPITRPMGGGLMLCGRAADGSEFPVEISLSPVRSNDQRWIMAAIRDVSKRLEDERNSRAIRHAIDTAVDGIFIIDDRSMEFTYVNNEAAAMHGYEVDEMLGMTPLHLAPELSRQTLADLIVPLIDGTESAVTIETTALAKDGSTYPVEVHVNHPTGAGNESGRSFVAVVRDITDRVRTAQELLDYQSRVKLVADRERLARDLHDRVIGDLFGHGMALQAALPHIADHDAAKRVGDTVTGLDRVIRLLRDTIFDLTSTASGEPDARTRIRKRVTDLHDRLGHPPNLTMSGPIDELSASLVDEATAVVNEALTNIAKHAKADSTDIAIDANEDQLTITVTDDGIGLPNGTTPSTGGLGLANMRARARNLGGSCTVDPGATRGLTLTWTVPTSER